MNINFFVKPEEIKKTKILGDKTYYYTDNMVYCKDKNDFSMKKCTNKKPSNEELKELDNWLKNLNNDKINSGKINYAKINVSNIKKEWNKLDRNSETYCSEMMGLLFKNDLNDQLLFINNLYRDIDEDDTSEENKIRIKDIDSKLYKYLESLK